MLNDKQETAYQNRKCWQCITRFNKTVNLIKRDKPPRTASEFGKKHYEYWQCPNCKINYAY